MIETSLPPQSLVTYLCTQLNNTFPDGEVTTQRCQQSVMTALDTLEYCFSKLSDKYLAVSDVPVFNHLHTDHYAMFLYFVSRASRVEAEDIDMADRLYALNKSLHAIDVYHGVQLPKIFFFQHPLGTVLGNAHYADYFVVYQRCTVGGKDAIYPRFNEGVVMYGDSAVIGDCNIGRNVWLSAGTRVMGEDIKEHSVVFGASPNLTVKPTRRNVRNDLFL